MHRRSTAIWLPLATALALTAAVPAWAATWTVARDGSGDFTVIQDAVDAASSGDVIEIRAGRYDEYQTIYSGGVPVRHVYVHILGKSLTLVGEGAGATVIGPEDPDHHPWPGVDVMLVDAREYEALGISGLGFEHSPFRAIHCVEEGGRLEVEGCIIRGGNQGIVGSMRSGGHVRDSLFQDLADFGVLVISPTADLEVTDCEFNDVRTPVYVAWGGAWCHVVSCSMTGGATAIGFVSGAGGSVTSCTIRETSHYALIVDTDNVVTLRENLIEQDAGWGLALAYAERTVVQQNIFSTETGTCVYLPYPCDGMVFSENHLLRGNGNYAKVNDYWPYTPPTYFDLTHNYWGTTDLDEIAEHIYDGHDNPEIQMFVEFDPIADAPVRVEPRSWSDVKSLFRGDVH